MLCITGCPINMLTFSVSRQLNTILITRMQSHTSLLRMGNFPSCIPMLHTASACDVAFRMGNFSSCMPVLYTTPACDVRACIWLSYLLARYQGLHSCNLCLLGSEGSPQRRPTATYAMTRVLVQYRVALDNPQRRSQASLKWS